MIQLTVSLGPGAIMLAVIEKWEEGSGSPTDNTGTYLYLMLFKLGMDASVFGLFYRKLNGSFSDTCSLSIVLADVAMALCMAAVWLLGAERSPVLACFYLAHISTIFGALPLPVMCLVTLDYCIDNTCTDRGAFCKPLRNVLLTMLMWILAVIHSFCSVKAELTELVYETGMKASVCEMEESTLVNHLMFGLFSAVILTMLPFWSSIPRWLKEANRLSELREVQDKQRSDLFTSNSPSTEKKSGKEDYQEENILTRPPLWSSLTMGFAVFWMPYLTVVAIGLVSGLRVPAYITVNLLWLECTNSFLIGVVFWVKSRSQGPYSHLPEKVCLWHIYWHLSKGTWQQHLPTAVFDPSMEKRNTHIFYV